MKKKIGSYTVIVERQPRTGSEEYCYMAFVPILGIATEADTLEEVQEKIKELIKFHLESLAEEGEEIPVESEETIITRTKVEFPIQANFSF